MRFDLEADRLRDARDGTEPRGRGRPPLSDEERAARKERGAAFAALRGTLKQSEIAEVAGVTPQLVSQWETGRLVAPAELGAWIEAARAKRVAGTVEDAARERLLKRKARLQAKLDELSAALAEGDERC